MGVGAATDQARCRCGCRPHAPRFTFYPSRHHDLIHSNEVIALPKPSGHAAVFWHFAGGFPEKKKGLCQPSRGRSILSRSRYLPPPPGTGQAARGVHHELRSEAATPGDQMSPGCAHTCPTASPAAWRPVFIISIVSSADFTLLSRVSRALGNTRPVPSSPCSGPRREPTGCMTRSDRWTRNRGHPTGPR
ncbi:unnamed protein product [Rangifer tarandus platyrhynchus]|uniref:Uncharacterized protein n=1 Tax=Rangifer tarandus platyrhynchus TaxID=3082113 RepID=A0AC59YG69_RANTA